MAKRAGAIRIVALVITVLILAAAPLFANNPLSERIWPDGDNGPGHRPHPWSHILSSPSSPPKDGPKGPAPHDWNPDKEPAEELFSYEHSNITVGKFPSKDVRNRYGSVEVWRHEDEVMPVDEFMVAQREPRERPFAKPLGKFKHKAEWMEQQIVADYPEHPLVNDTFVLIKTGSQTQWSRIPWHIYTTLPRVQHFGLYSDQQGSVAGYEVMDILHDLPADVTKKDEFKRYKLGHQMSEEQWNWDGAELNITGGWALDKYKNMPMLHHAYKVKPDAKWYFMIDDDTFVFWDNFYHLLDKYDPSKPYYLGSPAYLGKSYPFAHGGSGIVLSQGAMAKLFDRSDLQNKALLDEWARKASKECCGDYITAIALDSVGIHLDKLGFKDYTKYGGPFQGGSIWGSLYIPERFEQRPITMHHIDGQQAEVLYEYDKFQAGSGGFTNAEFYRDFILPYLSVERRNWRMPRRDKFYDRRKPKPDEIQDPEYEGYARIKDNGLPLFPYLNKTSCKRTCELDNRCVMWCHSPMLCELSYEGVSLGRASNPSQDGCKKDNANIYTTGWMIDKIRHMRADSKSDPLEYNKETKKWNDNEDTREGWFWDKLKKDNYSPFDNAFAVT